MKRIVANEEFCIGCGLCEVYCCVQHSKSKDIIKAYNRENPRPLSRVRLEVNKTVSLSSAETVKNAPCVIACLSGAMQKDESIGLVIHNAGKCMGCWTCIMVCPYGAIKMDSSGRVVSKCDFCSGIAVPVCVANCPNGALVLKEVKP